MIPSAPLGTDAAAGLLGLGAATGAAPGGAAAERRFRFELAAHPGSPAQARRLTRARLSGWSVCEDTCDTAVLVVSELVTNAIVHTASSHIVCELHDGDDLVRIAVRDEGCAPGEPHPSPQRPDEEHGRGLLLIDALCRAWGAKEHGPGLLVWADLPRQADPTHGLHPAPGHDSSIPRNDLGWGARPKPVPSGGTGDEDEATAHFGAFENLGVFPGRGHGDASRGHGGAGGFGGLDLGGFGGREHGNGVGPGSGTGSVHRSREVAGHFGEPGREDTGTSRGRGHLDAGDLPDSADTAGTGDVGGFGDFGSGVAWV
ncbi:ATP-binding protein [Streptomyces sp. NBC_01622]|nr:ATP-binding protein [Streptomyces sp. NBC_01622]